MNHYPPCSHPDIIEGLYAHSDTSVVLIGHQGLERGLQILKVDKWVGV
jgi:aminocyclopropanecarboxylate oxidase